jgi:raffinose/stachyose/melibiose transport system permease protein
VLLVAILLGLLIAVPFLLILINSFKSPGRLQHLGPLTLPTSLYFDGIVAFWERVDFPQKLWNSVFISGVVAVLAVLPVDAERVRASASAGSRGRLWIVVVILLGQHAAAGGAALPAVLHVQGGRPLRQPVGRDHHLHGHPVGVRHRTCSRRCTARSRRSCSRRRRLDGASRWQILWRVVYPISRPTLSVLLIFFFIWTWNEFLIPLTFLVSNDTQTVPVAITVLQGDRLMDVTTTSASALLGLIPTLVFFLIFQRTLTRGITAGAVK